ncbi:MULTISPECIES: hypothetical protein [unclassified Streptomyces]|uniref:hypothetical protein n=1 Tax=unclassified Streptomyces TaxID=2593676 RepID=UPI002254F2F6|nr:MULTISPECIES: hypothetical protein [unclassified Streptomyces]MCX4529763.1 hypothetical protein [Streptomyces sp. NBC_01551]MCX4539665.1 hypothetical protein [Streptomyces sp. NBC_01565]
MVPAAPRRTARPAPRRQPEAILNTLWGHGGDYQTWTDHLRRWAEEGAAGTGDAAARLPRLRPEDFHHETWVRLVNQLTEAVSRRLQACADSLTGALAEAADEFAAGRALVQSRPGFDAVRALASHPSLPEDVRTRLRKLVDDQIEGLQRQLEEQLERAVRRGTDRTWAEERRRTLRDNPLTTASAAAGAGATAPAAAPAPGGWSYDPATPTRRRVITD